MITRTEHGYALGHWEATLQRLSNGTRFTSREARVVLCRMQGMSHREAGAEIGTSGRNVESAWQSIYYKTRCSSPMVAITRLMEEGALHRLSVLLLTIIVGGACLTTDSDVIRPRQPARQMTRIGRTRRDEQCEISPDIGPIFTIDSIMERGLA